MAVLRIILEFLAERVAILVGHHHVTDDQVGCTDPDALPGLFAVSGHHHLPNGTVTGVPNEVPPFAQDMLTDIIPFVESNYRVIVKPGSRAVADNLALINKDYKAFVFTQGGPSDIAYQNCLNTRKALESLGLKFNYMENAQAGHSWATWRADLQVLAPTLFR